MSNDKGGSAGKQGLDALLHEQLRLGVDAGGCLVQYQNAGLGDEGAGKGEKLFLSNRKPAAPLRENGVIAFFQLFYKTVGADGFCGFHNFFVRGVKPAVADILLDGAGEEKIVLRHDAHIAAQTFQSNVPHIYPVNQHMPARGVVKTANQVDNGGLAGAGGSHQRDGFPGRNMKVYMLQHFDVRCVRVSKGDVFKGDFAGDIRKHFGIFLVCDGGRGIQYFKNTVSSGNIGDNLVVKAAQIGNRVPEHIDVVAEGN